ncbi:NADP-dependent oxidoreductase [Streptomyces qinzhouensis]|uniref:NADP-dependent oxidoreductase n=1 Tax=Streptomyces qinzhouensis TaxID=2599401 RepID=A0A5B8JST0_9ACTN|nr:NADP-dependent oxidoreductase [Streptomyces qinzhouensis]QDY80903.1 NADP-dependent oxidoreductase [Streptomyces qinzhouensis]
MKVIQFAEFGGPDVLEPAERELPEPGPGQVRLRIVAAGVNPVDYKIRSGALQNVFPTPLPSVPGVEAAGVVDATGPDVRHLAVGDEAFGFTDTGAYAEFALASIAVPKPPELSFEEAAALTLAAETAQRTLDLLELSAGETVLIHGAAGGVGTAAAQLALARGARVIGTASPARHSALRALGVTPVAYGDGLVARVREAAPDGVDAVLDAAGKGVLPESIELRGGTTDRIVTIADPAAADYGIPYSSSGRRDVDQLAAHAVLAAEGRLRIPVAEVFPLTDAGRAQYASEHGHAPGKLILKP